MKRSIAILISIFLLAFIQDNKTFQQLHSLKGTWKMQTKRGAICEEWKIVNKDYLQSKGYYIKGADTIVNETVALENKNGGIFYTSTVANQNEGKPTAFKLTSSASNKFVFENPAHDFPKRLVYELVNKDSLHAFIDDGNDASNKRSHFYYSRAKE